MDLEAYALLAVLLVAITSIVLLVQPDWRISIAAVMVQAVGVFILVALRWPVGMAAVKLLSEWMSGAVLGMAVVSQPERLAAPGSKGMLTVDIAIGRAAPDIATSDITSLASRMFRVLAAVLVGLCVASLAPSIVKWTPGISLEIASGGLTLIGIGLLQLGFTARPFRTVLGLLTTLAGFEILYAAVEVSILVAGLLAAVNLSLALAGAYLMLSAQMEAE